MKSGGGLIECGPKVRRKLLWTAWLALCLAGIYVARNEEAKRVDLGRAIEVSDEEREALLEGIPDALLEQLEAK